MPLLGLAIVAALFVFAGFINRDPAGFFFAHLNVPSLAFVAALTVFPFIHSRNKHFAAGIKAMLYRPAESNTEASNFFRKVAVQLVAFCAVITGIGVLCEFILLKDPNVFGIALTIALLPFFYAALLALLVFLPLSHRLSDAAAARSSTTLSLFSAAAFLLMLVSMVLIYFAVGGQAAYFWSNVQSMYGVTPQRYYDLPSFFFVVLTLAVFRLAVGKLPNRLDWVPVCILTGVFWSADCFIAMLCNFDTDKMFSGYSVVLLSSYYGFLFALAAIVNKPLFCTSLGAGWSAVLLAVWFFDGIANISPEHYYTQSAALIASPVFFGVVFDLVVHFVLRSQPPERRLENAMPA